MSSDMKTLVYPVRDIGPAVALFRTLLGVEP